MSRQEVGDRAVESVGEAGEVADPRVGPAGLDPLKRVAADLRLFREALLGAVAPEAAGAEALAELAVEVGEPRRLITGRHSTNVGRPVIMSPQLLSGIL